MNPISQASSRIFPLSQQEPLSPLNPMPVSQGTPATGAVGTFESVLGQVLAPVSASSVRADQAVTALATGQATDLHQVSLAVAENDLAFRVLLEIRNRLTDAYQEISRMQV